MSRFTLPQEESKRQELRALYREMGLAEGKAPSNFFTGMALRPDLLRGAWALTKSLYGGQLPDRLRELILTAVSAHHEAHYCCLAHAAKLRQLDVPADQIESVLKDPQFRALPDPERGVLCFALRLSQDPNRVDTKEFENLRAAGYSDELLMEVVMTAAFANWSNTWSSAADILLD